MENKRFEIRSLYNKIYYIYDALLDTAIQTACDRKELEGSCETLNCLDQEIQQLKERLKEYV